jgi:hypothetical protein
MRTFLGTLLMFSTTRRSLSTASSPDNFLARNHSHLNSLQKPKEYQQANGMVGHEYDLAGASGSQQRMDTPSSNNASYMAQPKVSSHFN